MSFFKKKGTSKQIAMLNALDKDASVTLDHLEQDDYFRYAVSQVDEDEKETDRRIIIEGKFGIRLLEVTKDNEIFKCPWKDLIEYKLDKISRDTITLKMNFGEKGKVVYKIKSKKSPEIFQSLQYTIGNIVKSKETVSLEEKKKKKELDESSE